MRSPRGHGGAVTRHWDSDGICLSSDNWRRPGPKSPRYSLCVEEYLLDESRTCAETECTSALLAGAIAFRRRSFRDSICRARHYGLARSIELRIAMDYSGRDAILRAACWMLSSLEVSQSEFARGSVK